MKGKYISKHLNDLANEYFKSCGVFGEKDSDVFIKVCRHYLLTAHKDINGSYDGQGKAVIAKIDSRFKGGSQWLDI